MLVPRPGGHLIEHPPPMSARRWHMLRIPSPDAAVGDSKLGIVADALKPLPLSEMLIAIVALSKTIEIVARVAPECLRMLVSASCVARNKWWRICEESGCDGSCVGMSSSHSIPVI